MNESNRTLQVYLGQELVGTLHEADEIFFSYSEAWLKNKRPPISLSMPLRESSYHKEAQTYFGNLLPEGDFRRRIELLFKVSLDNDFSLLNEIGGDSAGALTIGINGGIWSDEEAFYEVLSEDAIADIIRSEGLSGMGSPGQSNRLSLAGAQGKLPLRYRQNRFEMPHKGAASTHIIKFNRQSGEYPRLVENEYYLNRVAYHLGLPVIECQLIKAKQGTILVANRYDRIDGAWPVRIHQEDYCQALAYPYQRKYEKEGGPNFAQCLQFTRENLGILAVNQLVDWFIFNLMMGNSDAHAKNLSIIHGVNGYALAPFYDLVCTRAYPRLDRRMAMAFGGEFDPDLIDKRHLDILVSQTKITRRYWLGRIQKIIEMIPLAMKSANEDAEQMGVKNVELQQVRQSLKKIHRVLFQKFDVQ